MNSKLRFYLRGLGIGIFVTALILSIVNLNKKLNNNMTDAEVIARAQELGMVNGNSYSLTDATGSKPDETETSDDKSEPMEGVTGESEEDGTGEITDANTETGNVVAGDAESGSAGTDDTEAGSAVADDTESGSAGADNTESQAAEQDVTEPENVAPETTVPENVAPETTVPENVAPETTVPENTPTEPAGQGVAVIVIRAGFGSETAAALIRDAGVVTDANDFNAYMCRNGYDRTIHVGTFEIPFGSSYEEICKIIAG